MTKASVTPADNSAQNLSLWNSVRTPNPEATKAFSRTGGFKGTATNAVYLIQRATELWGPMGGLWGVEVVDDRIIQGAPILKNEVVIGAEQLHVLRINLRHPGGLVPSYGQTMLVGVNKYGPFTDEEAPKKSLTDALTKALSWLGFAADIHMGLWDDNKYVAEVKRQFAGEATEAATRPKIEVSQVQRVTQAIANGNAAGSATYLAGLPQAKLDAIWSALSAEDQQALTAAWPTIKGAT